MKEYPYLHEHGRLPPTLAKVPFLSSVSETALDELLNHTSIIECEPGDLIIREGDTSDHFFILLKGEIQVTREGEEIARIDSAGELIGERAHLDHAARSATVRAIDHVYCIKVDPNFLQDLSNEERQAYYAVLYRFLTKLMADRLQSATDRIAQLEKALAKYEVPSAPYSLD